MTTNQIDLDEARKVAEGVTPAPWEDQDNIGAGLEIYAPIHLVDTVEWPKPPSRPAMTFTLTGPAGVKLIACERWVQFEPKGWHEMQVSNSAFIIYARNNWDAMVDEIAELRAFHELHTDP